MAHFRPRIGRLSRWFALFLSMLFTFGASPIPVLALPSKSDLELEVLEDLPVFAKPRLTSNPVGHLQKGDFAIISTEVVGGFRRVWISADGEEIEGFVSLKSIRRSVIKKPGSNGFGRLYTSKVSYGVAMIPNYLRQGEGHFSLSDNSEYKTSNFESVGSYFGLFADIPLNADWGLRPYLSYRQTFFTGSATQTNSLSPTPSNPKVSRKQTLFSAGVSVKKNWISGGSFWWGGGAEFGKGQSLELKLDGQLMPTTNQDLPIFFIGYGAVGWNTSLLNSRHFYFVPELKLGMIGTTSPFTAVVEAWLPISYQP